MRRGQINLDRLEMVIGSSFVNSSRGCLKSQAMPATIKFGWPNEMFWPMLWNHSLDQKNSAPEYCCSGWSMLQNRFKGLFLLKFPEKYSNSYSVFKHANEIATDTLGCLWVV